MAKISNPKSFSSYFGLSQAELSKLGILDPMLNVDTQLFIDPLLLERSSAEELRRSRVTYINYFEKVVKLIVGIKSDGDAAWRAAYKLLSFPEVKGLCLGYGAGNISGRGSGREMTRRMLQTSREIVTLGIDDPDLFAAMALFEKDFGPDMIGDMAANVIIADLIDYNKRVAAMLRLPMETIQFRMANGFRATESLVRNPLAGPNVPLLLVPMDILRPLPIAASWADVTEAAKENEDFRSKLSADVLTMWSRKTLENKGQLKTWAMSGEWSFTMLLQMIHGHEGKPYDFLSDPRGEMIWRRIGKEIVKEEPLEIAKPSSYELNQVSKIATKIIDRFKFLIEDRRLSEELFVSGKPRPERSSQRLFYAISDAYCQANDIDLTPEADTGNGPVDFKLSTGKSSRVLVEIKLSSNPKVVAGYEKQLTTYRRAEEAAAAYYVVLDVGGMGNKRKKLDMLHRDRQAAGLVSHELIFIDGLRRPSASTL